MFVSLSCSVGHAGGLDADGDGWTPTHGAVQQPLLVRGAPQLAVGSVAFGVGAGFQRRSLVSSDGVATQGLVTSAVVARVGVVARLHERVFVEGMLPARLAAANRQVAPAVSDGHLGVGLSLVDRPLAQVAAHARLGLPTGSPGRFSGSGRWVPGASVSARGVLAGVTGAVEVGVDHEGQLAGKVGVGGVTGVGAVGLGVGLHPRIRADVSARVRRPLDAAVRDARGTAAEAAVQMTARTTRRTHVSIVGRHALADGVGAPAWSAGLAFAAVVGGPDASDGLVAVPGSITVVTPDGRPVAGAAIGPERAPIARTDAMGRVHLSSAERADRPMVSAPGLVAAPLPATMNVLVLRPPPVPLSLRVDTVDGVEVEPKVQVSRGRRAVVVTETDDHVYSAELSPGEWTVAVSAPGFATVRRSFEVGPGHQRAVAVDTVLRPASGKAALAVDVRGPDGQVALTEVLLDGVPIGRGPSGRVEIDGVATGPAEVRATSRHTQDWQGTADIGVDRSVGVDLRYKPGTVRFRALSDAGVVRDGIVSLDGSESMLPIRLDERGERLVQMSDGEWYAMLSSPSFGLQERQLTVDVRAPGVLDVPFMLQPAVGDGADLLVMVRDDEGRPAADVPVWFDDNRIGTTGVDGEAFVAGLPIGRGELGVGWTARTSGRERLRLRPGLQRIDTVVSPPEQGVRVTATSTMEGPADADVRFDGPAPYAGGRLGTDGRRLFSDVPRGRWELTASHALGMDVAWADVLSKEALTDVTLRFGKVLGDAALALSVVDDAGQPIAGVQVQADGLWLGLTDERGRLSATGLADGPAVVRVEGAWHGPVSERLRLSSVADTQQITVPWAAGVVDVSAVAGGEAVRDGQLFIAGPEPRETLALGSDGQLRTRLAPGEWTMMVSSAREGLAERQVIVTDHAGPPQTVVMDLRPSTDVVVEVVDRRRRPVADAPVQIDGVDAGRTDASGILRIARLGGAVSLTAGADDEQTRVAMRVPEDQSTALLQVLPATRGVTVQVRAQGRPIEAFIGARGRSRVAPVRIVGEGELPLSEGDWELYASASGLGTARQRVTITDKATTVVFDLAPAVLERQGAQLTVLDVLFAIDESVPLSRYERVLEEVAATMLADPSIRRVEVQGHTDSSGNAQHNFALSRRRAEAVVTALVARGVDPNLLGSRGFGPTRPIASNDTTDGRRQNRRVTFVVTEEE